MYVMYGKKWYSPSNVCAICDIKLLQLVGCHLSNTYKLTGIPGHIVTTVSFSKVVLSQGAVNKVFLGVFLMFLAFFHSKIWAKFHFGTFEPYK